METTSISTATATPATAKKSVISSDFDTFLKMLTTQIKNQDPTNPMDSSDFAVQLATFSGVEQQVRTNDLLGDLGAQFGVMGMSQLGAWVGQEARAPGPVWLGDRPVTITYESAAGADRAVLSVRNAQGVVVGREDVSLGKGPYDWQGMAFDGTPLPDGKYTLLLESYRGDQQTGNASEVQSYSRIQEARGGANGTMLVLEGGIEVAATQVTALRMAGSDAMTNQNP
jgi:flagellar basal-body rod modification protein FlgD